MMVGTNSSGLGLTMADDLPKLLNSLHAVLLATVVGALPAVLPAALTKRDQEPDKYQRENLHNQIPEYRHCVSAGDRVLRRGVPRVDIGGSSWWDPVWEYPLTAHGWGTMQTPGHDRVLLDDDMNYIGVIARDATVVNRDNYQRWHWVVSTNRDGHRDAYMDYPGMDWMQTYFFPTYGFLLAWNWLASGVPPQSI
ncbi:hypothetical protein DL771_009787 [Monosporascus sp. 5C6A]|nr:hypothetical protein DL771_009787 [Monosporascus sp. 5C6A]